MYKVNEVFKDEKKSIELFFIITSILFGFIVCLGKLSNDDTYWYSTVCESLSAQWQTSVDAYYTWSSRVLINFIWFFVMCHGRISWLIYMAVSFYVLSKALYMLSFNDHSMINALFVVGVCMLFPMNTLVSAGWIATTTSYFGPQAFGILCIVPIKKALAGKKIGLLESVLYFISMIYAANAEQVCVALLFLYTIAVILLFAKRKMNWQILILYALNIASLVFMMTCPGNWGRSISEKSSWFPTFDMLNTVDKLELGVSTTLHWIIVGSNILFIALFAFLFLTVCKKYDGLVYKVVAAIPFVASIAFGPLSTIISSLYPSLSHMSSEIDYYGAFNVEKMGLGPGAIQFGFFILISFCLLLILILLEDTIEDYIVDTTIILAAFGSRVMMGLTPTIYASSTRTYTTLIVLVMVVFVRVFAKNKDIVLKDNTSIKHIEMISVFSIIFGLSNLICLVATMFY